MKILFFFPVLFILAWGCQNTSNSQIYKDFVDGYYHKGFNEFSHLVADTIILKDGDYQKKYSQAEYNVYYQWDSVFKPEYKLIEMKELDGDVMETTAITSKRFEFLGQHPLITRKKIIFKNGKITKIENLAYKNVDWKVWTSNRDSLVQWIDRKHPELAGFIHDMTKQGAENYLKAIQLYNQR